MRLNRSLLHSIPRTKRDLLVLQQIDQKIESVQPRPAGKKRPRDLEWDLRS